MSAKPDADIFRVALDTAQAPAHQVVYLEDQPMFVEVAESLGIRGIRHTDYRYHMRETSCVRIAA